jgi:4-hydroxybenzoate polyprenyltransferase
MPLSDRFYSAVATSLPSAEPAGRSVLLTHDPLPVGGIAVALMLGTTALLGLPVDGPLLGLACCGTALVYLADRALGLSPEDRVNRPGRRRWRRRFRGWIRVEAALLALAAAVLVPLLQWKTLTVAAALGGVGALHVLPVLPGGSRLKAVGFLKPYAVAGVWAVGAVLLPVVEAGRSVTAPVLWLTAYRFALILPNLLLADWADRAGDAAAGLRTWAQGWSRRSVQGAGTGLLAVALLGAGGAVAMGAAPPLLLVDAVGGLLLGGALWRLRPGASAGHALLLDLLVGWPVVTWGVWVLG